MNLREEDFHSSDDKARLDFLRKGRVAFGPMENIGEKAT
jgi:hypothetical protein